MSEVVLLFPRKQRRGRSCWVGTGVCCTLGRRRDVLLLLATCCYCCCCCCLLVLVLLVLLFLLLVCVCECARSLVSARGAGSLCVVNVLLPSSTWHHRRPLGALAPIIAQQFSPAESSPPSRRSAAVDSVIVPLFWFRVPSP